MKVLVIFSVAIVAVIARPSGEQVVSVSQDTLGNYKLKYAIEGISRVEQRDVHGNVIGAFSFIDPHGILRKTEFTAGVHGVNAVGTDIPLPVVDTPEVAAAKAHHLTLLRAAELTPKIIETAPILRVAEVPVVKSLPLVAPAVIAPAINRFVQLGAVPETPEVLVARAEHLAAHEAARKLLIH